MGVHFEEKDGLFDAEALVRHDGKWKGIGWTPEEEASLSQEQKAVIAEQMYNDWQSGLIEATDVDEYYQRFETDWERAEYDATADVVDITADHIRNRVYVTVRFYTKAGLSSYDIIYTGDLKQSGFIDAANLVLSMDSETYMNPITGDPNFVLVTEDIRDGEYERREHFVIDAESEAKMSDKQILEWQYGEGSVDEYDAANAEFWVHDERIHALEFQPISLSDALVLERLGIASRNYPYQDLKRR